MVGWCGRALAVAALLVCGYAAGAGAQGTQEFKIGIVLPLTGPGVDMPASHETPLRGITAFKYVKNSRLPAD